MTNENVKNTMALHRVSIGLYKYTQTALLVSAYSGLHPTMQPIHVDSVADWLMDVPIGGLCRSEILEMMRITDAVCTMEDADYPRVSFSYLSYVMSKLDGSTRNDYYLVDKLPDDVRRWLIKNIHEALCRQKLIRDQAAELFAVIAYPNVLSDNGVIAAAICASMHLLINGIGIMIPRDELVLVMHDLIVQWKNSNGDIMNPIGQEIVSTISNHCIWCA